MDAFYKYVKTIVRFLGKSPCILVSIRATIKSYLFNSIWEIFWHTTLTEISEFHLSAGFILIKKMSVNFVPVVHARKLKALVKMGEAPKLSVIFWIKISLNAKK